MLSTRNWNAGAARRQVSTIRINQFGENIWSRPLDDEFLAGVGNGNSGVPPTSTECLSSNRVSQRIVIFRDIENDLGVRIKTASHAITTFLEN